jgi:predicted acyltransferase (DUF342 family)
MYRMHTLHRIFCNRLLGAAIAGFLTMSSVAFAAAKPEHTQFGRDISVGPDEEVSDLTCIGCSIRIRGRVSGEATAVGGSIFIEDQGQVSGDVTAVAGNARLGREVKIAGDVTVVGGELRYDPHTNISGDVTNVGGRGWIIPVLLTPFLILGLLIAFVVWIVQRSRRPSTPPVPA